MGRYEVGLPPRLVAVLLGMLLLTLLACNGKSPATPSAEATAHLSAPTSPHADVPPELLAQLRQSLNAEFARLGIDPEKVASAAPSGPGNGVFDLAATVIDPDGPPDGHGAGELPPTGIELTWTERLIGDYDQNGEVNYSDITPLGLHFNTSVKYDDPALHGGFEQWPVGDPENTGGTAPPDPSSGAANWRLARIDGESNGELNFGDVTPLAVHWKERLSGYRVLFRTTESEQFSRMAEVVRPMPTSAGLYEYSYTALPSDSGAIEFCVVPFSAGEGQGVARSNIATAILDAGFADTTPPVWTGDEGISGAIDNGDGTATVEWGTAADIALPPASSSPPVTYDLYYCTVTPIDFANATKITGLTTSPWTSPQLVGGKTYHFAVRASDSASPPNEETNTNELPLSISGETIEDHNPPVWVESIAREGEEEYSIPGIKEIEVLDGKLVITHALAIDELTPPVHYDLYYISDDIADEVLYRNGELKGQLREGVQVVEDIPPVYEFEWPNRKAVHLHVKARDSAEPPNYDDNDFQTTSAPISMNRYLLDRDLPNLNLESLSKISFAHADDPFAHKFYMSYIAEHNNSSEEVWFIEVDANSATWTSKLLHRIQPGEELSDNVYIGRSWTGDIWTRWASKTEPSSYQLHFDILRTDGQWETWDAQDTSDLLDLTVFDHNGNPLLLDLEPSDVQQNRLKIKYVWWDSTSEKWNTEIVCDPGSSNCRSFVRRDGTLQLIMTGESKPPGDTTPVKSRVLERSAEGVWSISLIGVGYIGIDVFPATWGQTVEWSGGTNIHGTDERFYYSSGVFCFLPAISFRDLYNVTGRMWPAQGGEFHALPNYVYVSGRHVKQFLSSKNFSLSTYESQAMQLAEGLFTSLLYDPKTGFFSTINLEPDMLTGQYEFVLRTPTLGGSLFIPK